MDSLRKRRKGVKTAEAKPDYAGIVIVTFVITFVTVFTLSMLLSLNVMQCSVSYARECSSDQDCVCGGVYRDTGECFVGNLRYQMECVDLSQDCPDFCSGIYGDLGPRCVEGTCMIIRTW